MGSSRARALEEPIDDVYVSDASIIAEPYAIEREKRLGVVILNAAKRCELAAERAFVKDAECDLIVAGAMLVFGNEVNLS